MVELTVDDECTTETVAVLCGEVGMIPKAGVTRVRFEYPGDKEWGDELSALIVDIKFVRERCVGWNWTLIDKGRSVHG